MRTLIVLIVAGLFVPNWVFAWECNELAKSFSESTDSLNIDELASRLR